MPGMSLTTSDSAARREQYRQAATGQFGTQPRTPPGDGPDVRSPWQQRRDALLADGYVPAVATPTSLPPGRLDDGRRWWAQHWASGEFGHADGDFAKMPDDETPSHLPGQSQSSTTRTYRRRYTGAGVDLRMPAVAAVKRFAAGNDGATFDVPVTITTPNGTSQGWVRVTPGPSGQWGSQPLGFAEADADYVAESVSSVLEARQPTRSLAAARDLLARAELRRARTGTPPVPIDSSWIRDGSYDETTGTMSLSLDGRRYGYVASREAFERVATSYSPGRTFQHEVKGQLDRVSVADCGSCGRVYVTSVGHTCPTAPTGRRAPSREDRTRAAGSIHA